MYFKNMIKKKKDYIPPKLEVEIVEMECGISANSAGVYPQTVDGNTDEVQTDWGGNDDTSSSTPF